MDLAGIQAEVHPGECRDRRELDRDPGQFHDWLRRHVEAFLARRPDPAGALPVVGPMVGWSVARATDHPTIGRPLDIRSISGTGPAPRPRRGSSLRGGGAAPAFRPHHGASRRDGRPGEG
ncbi:hypothetical protein GCM10027059_23930 [Myceligenerans halotolerans]